MKSLSTAFPVKTRELHNHHMDSTVWNDFPFRTDDIVIATYAKSGTTWTQQIVGQLVFGGRADVDVANLSPWVDLRVPAREEKLAALEAQTHRRFLKTHLPVDALVFSEQARYIYVARDGRDVVWSMHNHHAGANDLWYQVLNDTPGRVGPPIGRPTSDLRAYFRDWLEQDGTPFWPFWENVRSWWAIRNLPNVLTLHFADMKRDLRGQVARIADFLGIEADEETLDRATLHSTFDYMKANASQVAPLGGVFWDGGAGVFIHKGTNGRWQEVLTAEDVADYEARAEAELGADCARWLAHGSLSG